jgi:hypothetical protein
MAKTSLESSLNVKLVKRADIKTFSLGTFELSLEYGVVIKSVCFEFLLFVEKLKVLGKKK